MKTSCLSEAQIAVTDLAHRPIYSVPLWLCLCLLKPVKSLLFFLCVPICDDSFRCFSAEKKGTLCLELCHAAKVVPHLAPHTK